MTLAGYRLELGPWAAIRTEVSCKYSETRVSELLAAAELNPIAWLTDAQRQVVDVACKGTAADGGVPTVGAGNAPVPR